MVLGRGHDHWYVPLVPRVSVTIGGVNGAIWPAPLQLLSQELNATPARLPGDRRPLTYQVAGT